ncbi:3-oxoacyl-[acyl-carrier protein] reductase [Rhodopseudomonas rhenobacensis]|uniref:3-oxoacyl-[acyl-carrier protein] reductase n=1 Tax=Rhodopseudomonas rhenobacensis TaxID=87461 RepID=A0A7W7Z1F8_9BRAD|nr:glucose 1-dehydrogenase [Rhodopseudomonas rhenobacensis]MBB5046139.1 3-oxoacyl-[acyl-carrier protein] reductase [Rhodopseudomonas rhenobacensis]
MSKLAGKVAVVTGASQGIGAGIARALAAEGAAVVVNYLKNKQAAALVVEAVLQAGGKAIAFEADVALAAGAERIIDAAIKNFGRLDVLVNNSGTSESTPLGSITEESFDKIFKVNVLGVLLTTQAAVTHLKEGGSVINIGSSITGMTPPAMAVYTASKAAVESITKTLSKELGLKRIRVNSVMPGTTDTEMFRSQIADNVEQLQGIIGMTPLGRIGQPSDIASVVTFLASEDAGWVTGASILTSGGL